MHGLKERYQKQLDRVKNVAEAPKGKVTLLAVSKTKPATDIAALYAQGQRDFGENYLQEALFKQKALAHFDIDWHFIGPIQSNKTKEIARRFAWVHSVDRLKIAKRLNEQRPEFLRPLNVCVQVNIDEEDSKSGFTEAELDQAIEQLKTYDQLHLRGLMIIPKVRKELAMQRAVFKKAAQLKERLNKSHHLEMDTLSMGMSSDLELAIEEGATIVRIGTAIFGERDKNKIK